jgi:tryptophan synthase alpha chain
VSVLADVLAKCRADNRAALIGYLPVGYPSIPLSIAAMRAMVAGGCDAIEVGVPYSDPVMDGPTIQAAVDPAVRAGVGLRDAFAAVSGVAEAGAAALTEAGGAGAITPDLLPDEAEPWLEASDAEQLDRIFLVAPSSTDRRIVDTAAASRGFVYATALMGVTGARTTVGEAAAALVGRVRALAPDVAVCVGVGVSTGDQAAHVAGFADGVIVGSAFVRRLLDAPDERGVAAVGELAAELAEGVRRRQ